MEHLPNIVENQMIRNPNSVISLQTKFAYVEWMEHHRKTICKPMLWLPKANRYRFMLETNHHKETPFSYLPFIWKENTSSENETYINDNMTNLFSMFLQKHIGNER